MSEIISRLLDFLNREGNVPPAEGEYPDHPHVRIYLHRIFGWLVRQHRMGHELPCHLRNPSLSAELESFLKIVGLDEKLEVIDNRLNFRKEVLGDERDKVRKLVAERYHPQPKFTSR